MEMIVATKAWLSSNFKMKDMGEASYVLGVKIFRDRSSKFLNLSQETYIRKILKRFHMQGCKPIDTPIEKDDTLNLECVQRLKKKKKRWLEFPILVLLEV